MLPLLQGLSGAILALMVFVWGSWIYQSYRPVRGPERLGQIVVANDGADVSGVLSKAIGIGVVSALDQSRDEIARINGVVDAAAARKQVTAMPRVSQPAPYLLKTRGEGGSIDLKVAVVGATVDAKGLEALLRRLQPSRETLEISVVLSERDTSGRRTGIARASFDSSPEFGFVLPVQGTIEEISRQIAMRVLQSHFAAKDSALRYVDPTDFRAVWELRKRVATMAVRKAGGAGAVDTSEASTTLQELQPFVARYDKWDDVQRLKAYLAGDAQDFEQAAAALEKVVESASPKERPKLERQLADLRTDSRVARETPTRSSGSENLEAQVLSQFDSAVIGPRSRAQGGRPVRIAIILAEASPFPQYGDRIQSFTPRGLNSNGAPPAEAVSHADSVAGLIAALAPTSEIMAVNVFGKGFTTSTSAVLMGIDAALQQEPDIVLIPLAIPPGTAFRRAIEVASAKALVIMPAGNDGREVERFDGENVVVVGTWKASASASYSGRGPGVTFYAPGEVLTFQSPTRLGRNAGTTYSAAIAAATAANVLAASPSDQSIAGLREHLVRLTVAKGAARVLLPAA